MTATGFLTDQPQFYISYQQVSLIPAGHAVLRMIDQHGEQEWDHDRVRVPQWVHDEVLRVLNNDQPADTPVVNGLRNIVLQTEEAMREERQRRLEDQMLRPTVTHTIEREPEYATIDELEEDIFDDTEEHEQVHQDFWRTATQAVNAEPLTPNALANALRTELIAPPVGPPRWFVGLGEPGAEPCVSLNIELPEPEAIEDIVNQFHDIEEQLASQLDEIMTWARETWREQNALPDQTAEGLPEGETVAAEDGRGAYEQQRGTELPRYTIDFGVPTN